MHTATTTTTATEWFASWFDSAHYHRLYSHRDDREAAAFITRLVEHLGLDPAASAGATALDLGCGAGRHARQLAAHGLDVTGLDLSAESIEKARTSERARPGVKLRFVRQDMREPFGIAAFDYVFSLFTSFGYFDDLAEHVTVLHNISSSLKPNGVLVLDYLNVQYAEAHQVREEAVERERVIYRVSRWSDSHHLFKRIAVEDVEYTERVAKLALEEFRFMFELSGLQIASVFGDYALQPFDAAQSPRLILIARKLAA
jgi:SAM-dependent methyltransferase